MMVAVYISEELSDKTLPYMNTRQSAQKRLHNAILAGDDMGVRTAIDDGANVNLQLADGPLIHKALTSANTTIKTLSSLRKAGADINSSDRDGNNPLAIIPGSRVSDNMKLARAVYLIEHGTSLNVQNNRGLTPLHYAARYHEQMLVTLYVYKGAIANVRDNRGRTALHWLVNYVVSLETAQRYCIERLVSGGAKLGQADDDGHVVSEQLGKMVDDPAWFEKLLRLAAGRHRKKRPTIPVDFVV